jgi:hypothetical protein
MKLIFPFSFVLIYPLKQSRGESRLVAHMELDARFSSNLARKKWRLEGNRETGKTTAEETKTHKPLMTQDFPITLKDFS